MEEHIYFDSNGLKIEGLLSLGSRDKGVVITHPHPLYGGDMYNPVVLSITHVYQKKGYSTLRFNFRGTGRSGGTFENGDGETSDVTSAIHFMKGKGINNCHLSGYSFGTWVNAMAIHLCDGVQAMTMVSPPVAFVDFNPIEPSPAITLVITGSYDDIAPSTQIDSWLGAVSTSVKLEIIAGADHFYAGYTHNLETIMAAHI
jgi:alpha/beta superfamily hydrolase